VTEAQEPQAVLSSLTEAAMFIVATVDDGAEDLSIGCESHDREGVRLYLEESFTFHVATPEAAVVLGQ
jgi:uncharacterized linocin/CFP29 family protein